MALNVTLEDENGVQIALVVEPVGAPLARSVSKAIGPRFLWASTIDPYGDTTFNYMQAKLLQEEWAILIAEAGDEKTRSVLLRINEILRRCVSERLHVKFCGD